MSRETRSVDYEAAAAERERAPRLGISTFRALAYRDFRYLWLGQISNSAALWIEQIARPILVLELTGSAVHLGLVLAARTLPQLGFGLLGGVFADWYNRRTILLISKSLAMIINFVFAILILTGRVELWHIYVTTVLKGIVLSFDNPARQALIPSLVPQEGLTNAVALNSASMNTMRIGGAFLAGLLLATVGIGLTFLTVALVYVGAVFFTFMMRVPPAPPVKEKNVRAAGTSFWEGAKYGWGNLTIRGILLLTMGYFTLGMAYMQVFAPLFAKQVLDIGDSGYGFMMSATGIGALTGALIIATLSPTRWRGRFMIGLMITLGFLLVLFSLSTYIPLVLADQRWVALTFGVIALVGMTQTSFFALSNTVLLETTPVDMRGRIMGLLSLDRAMITLGGTLAGFTAAALGPQPAQILFGAGCIVTAVLMSAILPNVRHIE